MAKQVQDKAIISAKFAKVYAEYKDKAFNMFFDSCAKETLQKNKSIYDLMQSCFTAGYWNAMKDMCSQTELRNAAGSIMKEINKHA